VQLAGSAAELSIGFHTFYAADGVEDLNGGDESNRGISDGRISAIDAIYSSVGLSELSDPHPMDDITAAILLKKRRNRR
jgi:hypothetical protein